MGLRSETQLGFVLSGPWAAHTYGDVIAFSGLSIHRVINLSDESCMVGRSSTSPASTLPLVAEILRRLEDHSSPAAERAALITVVQWLVNQLSAAVDGEGTHAGKSRSRSSKSTCVASRSLSHAVQDRAFLDVTVRARPALAGVASYCTRPPSS